MSYGYVLREQLYPYLWMTKMRIKYIHIYILMCVLKHLVSFPSHMHILNYSEPLMHFFHA